MNEQPSPNEIQGPLQLVSHWLREEEWAPLSVLCSLLDAHLLLGVEGLSMDDLQPLFAVWWPRHSLSELLGDLVGSGLATLQPGPSYAVAPGLRPALAAALDGHLAGQLVFLPEAAPSLEELFAGLEQYLREEGSEATRSGDLPEVWDGAAFSSNGRRHLILRRPFPLHLQAHPEAFILYLFQLPDQGAERLAAPFVLRAALRQRLALVDLEQGQKLNLTRSDVFVHFERYLRRAHGLRLALAEALTQGLVDGGLLKLEKG